MPWCGQQNIKIIRLWNFSGTRQRQKRCNYKNNFLLINCFWLEWARGTVLGAMWARRETAFCSLHTGMLIRWLASLWQAAALPSQSSGRSLTPGPAVCVDLWPQGSQGRGDKNWPDLWFSTSLNTNMHCLRFWLALGCSNFTSIFLSWLFGMWTLSSISDAKKPYRDCLTYCHNY